MLTGKGSELCVIISFRSFHPSQPYSSMRYPLPCPPGFLALLLLALALPSCKKTEELPLPLPTNREKILGTWTLAEELHYQGNDGQFTSILYPCVDDTWIFRPIAPWPTARAAPPATPAPLPALPRTGRCRRRRRYCTSILRLLSKSIRSPFWMIIRWCYTGPGI